MGQPWAGSMAQQQTGQLSRRAVKLKSHGMFLDKPQAFLNVILGKILCKQNEMLCFVETVCFYLEIFINQFHMGLLWTSNDSSVF